MNSKNRIISIIFLLLTTPLLAQFTVDNISGCDTLTVQFTDQSGSTAWAWDFDDGNTLNGTGTPNHFFADSGTYTVTLVADIGTYTKDIVVHKSPVASFDTAYLYYASFSVLFDNTSILYSPPDYFVWDFDDLSPKDTVFEKSYTYEQAGTYNVKLHARDAYGCTADTSRIITVSHQFFIPNVFTPNGDNINDSFMVLANGTDIFPEANFYNRWGTLVFRRQNVSQIVWDGRTFDGSLVTPGTYFYVITPPENSLNDYPSTQNIIGNVQVLYDRKTLE